MSLTRKWSWTIQTTCIRSPTTACTMWIGANVDFGLVLVHPSIGHAWNLKRFHCLSQGPVGPWLVKSTRWSIAGAQKNPKEWSYVRLLYVVTCSDPTCEKLDTFTHIMMIDMNILYDIQYDVAQGASRVRCFVTLFGSLPWSYSRAMSIDHSPQSACRLRFSEAL